MNLFKLAVGVVALCPWLMEIHHAQAQSSVAMRFTAIVTEVKDGSGVLQGAVYQGQTVTGNFALDSSGADVSPLTKVGAYQFTSASSSISLQAGAVAFSSDPAHVNLRLEVLNNLADGTKEKRDTFLLHSYSNLPILGGLPVDEISWQVDDFNATATASVAVPDEAPDLAKYRSIFGLVISGQDPDDPSLSYLVRAKVLSIVTQ